MIDKHGGLKKATCTLSMFYSESIIVSFPSFNALPGFKGPSVKFN